MRGTVEAGQQANEWSIPDDAGNPYGGRLSPGGRYHPGGRPAFLGLAHLASAARTAARAIAMILDSFWRIIMRHDLERHSAVMALAWGMWVLILQPIHIMNPSMRGFWLLSQSVDWLPWNADITWGILVSTPAVLQLCFLGYGDLIKARGATMLFQATTMLFIVILLALDNWRSTGIPMYGGLAVAHLISYAQLAHKRFSSPT